MRLVAFFPVDGLLISNGGKQPVLVLGGLDASSPDDGEGGEGPEVWDRDVERGGGPGGEGDVGGGDVLGWVEWVRGWGDRYVKGGEWGGKR